MDAILNKMFGIKYDDIWKAMIRPPRDDYNMSQLGKDHFTVEGKHFQRTDLSLINKRGLHLACSFWEPIDSERPCPRLPCVIYLHGNSSSRTEAWPDARDLLAMNITVFAFDFSGCGQSEGEYISLGWYETDDVECVVEYLRNTNKVSTIGLWGRSMGAVTAIMYGDRDPSIAGMVMDSPFSSLSILVGELIKDRVNIPSFVLNQGLKMVKGTIKKKANFNCDDIEPINFAKRCFIPGLFCHAKQDDFVNWHHCKDLYNAYQGEKNVVYFDEGDHNSIRPEFFKNSMCIFFYNTLQVENLKVLSDNNDGYKEEVKKQEPIQDPIPKPQVNNPININQNNNGNILGPNIDPNDKDAVLQQNLELSKKEHEMSQKNNVVDINK